MLKVVKDLNIYSKNNKEVLISTQNILEAINITNAKIFSLKVKTEKEAINIFDAIDFRMLSGMLGEALITIINKSNPNLEKNPHIDGYPDLVDVSSIDNLSFFSSPFISDTIRSRFNNYKFGGIEIKNTFGVKSSGRKLEKGDTRLGNINKKLDWKAHHTNTNYLLGIFSDFIDGTPQIVAAFYSDKLTSLDWKTKQNPKIDSAMTSFSTIERTGWEKMKSNMLICIDKQEYLDFFQG